jgi:hypothetical protein
MAGAAGGAVSSSLSRATRIQALRSPVAGATVYHDGSAWQSEIIRRYQGERQREAGAMQAELVARVRSMTGRLAAAEAVYVDLDARLAQVTLDGVMFRWRRDELVLVRPCAECGVGQFESPPLRSPADVGYALSVWRPTHDGCEQDEWLID